MTPKPVNWTAFVRVFGALAHVKYGLGDKAKLDAPPASIRRIDCSGFARYMAFSATGGQIMPDGSWNQRAWCETRLPEVPYTPAQSKLHIAFMTAGVNGVGSVGHVWFVRDGWTYESRGGKGVDARPWNTPGLKKHVHKTFAWPLMVVNSPFALFNSAGGKMDNMPIFDGHSYVAVRKMGAWFGLTVGWDQTKIVASLGGHVFEDTKLINNVAYVPFVEAADVAQLSFMVDNARREVHLKGRGR